MASAEVWSGISQGFSQAATDYANRDLREAQRQEAKAKQQKATMELEEFRANAPVRKQQSELAMEKLQAENRTLQEGGLHSTTMSAFNRYNTSKNIKHLNQWNTDAKKNPIGSNLYGSVARYDRVSKSSEHDQLLQQAGYIPSDVYDNKELSDQLIVVTQNDGSQTLLDNDTLYGITRFDKYLEDEDLTKQEREAEIAKTARSGTSYNAAMAGEEVIKDLMAKYPNMSRAQAYELLQRMNDKPPTETAQEQAIADLMAKEGIGYSEAYVRLKGKSGGSTNESRYIEQAQAADPNLSYEEAAKRYANLGLTSTQKENKDVASIRRGLDEANWLETRAQDMTAGQRAKIYRDYISPLEDLRGFKLSSEDKRIVRQMRDLTKLGATAGDKMTAAETGILDNTLHNFKKYMFSEVGGLEATASYETFRNVFRNSLYGASLTDSEIDAFNKAAGTLGQKFKPVMAQLYVQMELVKSNLEGLRDLNDPDIAHYYLGQSIDDIDQAIMGIEIRLDDPRMKLYQEKNAADPKTKLNLPNGEGATPVVTPPSVKEPTVKDATEGFNYKQAFEDAMRGEGAL